MVTLTATVTFIGRAGTDGNSDQVLANYAAVGGQHQLSLIVPHGSFTLGESLTINISGS